jgi:hypothetical protein
MQYIFGPILVILGILFMKYTVQITNFTGEIDFAERYFGAGIGSGTYTWWRVFGLILACLGGMWFLGITSLIGDALRAIFAIS